MIMNKKLKFEKKLKKEREIRLHKYKTWFIESKFLILTACVQTTLTTPF